MNPRVRARAGVRAALTMAILAVALVGCAEDPQLGAYNDGSGKGYLSGDGRVTEFPADSRQPAAEWEGVTDSGAAVSSADSLGDVTVLNFWYAECAPCRAEAADLEAVSRDFADQGVVFLGVNLRDQAPTARAFAEEFGVTYPSVIDTNDANVQLAFAATVPARSVPTTVVLDAEGRVAARILGQLQSASILESIIQDTIDEAG